MIRLSSVQEQEHLLKFSDQLRAVILMALDKIPLDNDLKIAVEERLKREEKMGPPQEPPQEAYEEEYLRLKGEFEKLNKLK